MLCQYGRVSSHGLELVRLIYSLMRKTKWIGIGVPVELWLGIDHRSIQSMPSPPLSKRLSFWVYPWSSRLKVRVFSHFSAQRGCHLLSSYSLFYGMLRSRIF